MPAIPHKPTEDDATATRNRLLAAGWTWVRSLRTNAVTFENTAQNRVIAVSKTQGQAADWAKLAAILAEDATKATVLQGGDLRDGDALSTAHKTGCTCLQCIDPTGTIYPAPDAGTEARLMAAQQDTSKPPFVALAELASKDIPPALQGGAEFLAQDQPERVRLKTATEKLPGGATLETFERLIIAAQCALAALSQPATYPADIALARNTLARALYVPEPTEPVNMLPELRRAAAAVVEEAGKGGRIVSPVIARAVDVLRQRLAD